MLKWEYLNVTEVLWESNKVVSLTALQPVAFDQRLSCETHKYLIRPIETTLATLTAKLFLQLHCCNSSFWVGDLFTWYIPMSPQNEHTTTIIFGIFLPNKLIQWWMNDKFAAYVCRIRVQSLLWNCLVLVYINMINVC